MIQSVNHKAILFAVISSAALTGCTQDVTDVYAYIEQQKAAHVGSVRPIPQFKPYETFTYTAYELRDPFEAAIDIEEEENKDDLLSPDQSRPRQPLEAFPLDTLRMVGVLEQGKNLWGLIEDPKNVVHRVQVGNYMGQNEGAITGISEAEIFLVEIISDGVGGYIDRNASIAIG
ncbi:MAG: pilus assembly protein PilP, partial [Gammaproteobacteria bacterium]